MTRLAHAGDHDPAGGGIDGTAGVDEVVIEPFAHQAKRIGLGGDHLDAALENTNACGNFRNGKADTHVLAPH